MGLRLAVRLSVQVASTVEDRLGRSDGVFSSMPLNMTISRCRSGRRRDSTSSLGRKAKVQSEEREVRRTTHDTKRTRIVIRIM